MAIDELVGALTTNSEFPANFFEQEFVLGGANHHFRSLHTQ